MNIPQGLLGWLLPILILKARITGQIMIDFQDPASVTHGASYFCWTPKHGTMVQ